jgi:hypothetical protein
MEGKSIYKQLSDIQKAIPVIEKGQRNDFQKYNFRGIDDIYNNLSGILANNQVLILPKIINQHFETIYTEKGNDKKVAFKVYYVVEFTFLSLIDGSSVVMSMAGEGADASDKTTGKAMSNTYKYALAEMFMIPFEDINDSDQSSKKEGNDLEGSRKAAKLALEKSDYPEPKKKAMIAGLKNYDIVFLEKIINGDI